MAGQSLAGLTKYKDLGERPKRQNKCIQHNENIYCAVWLERFISNWNVGLKSIPKVKTGKIETQPVRLEASVSYHKW